MKQLFVYITTDFEFIHYYKDAPKEVEYLKYPHRHLAHVKVKIEVFDEDREIEFIILKHQIQKYLKYYESKKINSSCEFIANRLLCYLQVTYGNERDIEIEVNEDNENGSIIVYEKEF